MNFSLKDITLRKKFLVFSTVIMVGFALLLSAIYYSYMKKVVVQDALEKSNLILQEVEAIRSYVKDELRPKMFSLHGEDKFILEAMSTTYISIRIMKLFQSQMQGYTYRRVAQNPHNPDNSTTPWEDQMFDWFEKDKNRLLWQGQVEGENSSSFVTVIPDYMEKECLRCHGKPADAPESLIEKYGNVGGFRFKEGDLAGLNSVAVPIAAPLSRLTTLSGVIFLITLIGSLLLLLIINVLFDKLVVSRLARMVDALGEGESAAGHTGEKNGQQHQPKTDELDSLQTSFQQLNSYVRTARRGDNLQPNFIGSYVIGLPVATGAMSWLYRGRHSESGEKVLIKIPFNNIHINPLYRAWYQAELQLVQRLVHPGLMKPRERIEDIVVFDDLKDAHPLHRQVLSQNKEVQVFFTSLFEIIAYLHTEDIVHHDLRPENFFTAASLSPILIDFGLAHQSSQADIIFASGMGPQGDFNYMAPEQIKGQRGDCRSDIYSIGVMLYYIHTSVFPYEAAPTSLQGWLAVKRRANSSITRTENLSRPLKDVITKAMAYDLEERYQWIEDMRDDYLQCFPS